MVLLDYEFKGILVILHSYCGSQQSVVLCTNVTTPLVEWCVYIYTGVHDRKISCAPDIRIVMPFLVYDHSSVKTSQKLSIS